jgi:hypothetical protein
MLQVWQRRLTCVDRAWYVRLSWCPDSLSVEAVARSRFCVSPSTAFVAILGADERELTIPDRETCAGMEDATP